eukprot:scaffold543_cov119-Cylindrotheca_fusiformis.AAC.27
MHAQLRITIVKYFTVRTVRERVQNLRAVLIEAFVSLISYFGQNGEPVQSDVNHVPPITSFEHSWICHENSWTFSKDLT